MNMISPIDLPEERLDRLRPSTASNLLLWIIAGAFIAFLIWAALTELDRTVHAQGRVVARSHAQVVNSLEGGVIAAVGVKVGDAVRAGQPLVRLEQVGAAGELGSSNASVAALQAKVARLTAEIRGATPNYPAAATPELAGDIAVERALHEARMGQLASVRASGAARAAEAGQALNEALSTRDSRRAVRDGKKHELDIIAPLVAKGIEPRMSLTDAQSQYSSAESELAAAEATVARARAAIGEAHAASLQQVQDWRTLAGNDLTTAQGELSARRNLLPALANKVARTVLRSPLDGRVNRVFATTVGAAVSPGAPIVEVSPSHDSLLIEAMVRPQDIGFIRLGQHARVNVSAYEQAIYGSLYGDVVAIAPDVTTNEKTGESFYVVQIRTETNALKDKSGHPLPIGTGMTADVNLLGNKRSVLSYLLTPITRIGESALRE